MRNPHFTGRDEVIERIRAVLTGGGEAVVTQAIAGLGGVGKSETAIEYAHRHRDAYDLVWSFRAETGTSLAADIATLAREINLAEKDEPQQALVIEAVRRELEARPRWLLILDNAEDRDTIAPILPTCGTGHVLITSRTRIWRKMAPPIDLSVWPRSESVAFLAARRSVDPDADRLADALGDLPLALDQAAAYCDETGMGYGRYLELLDKGHGAELRRRPVDYERTVAMTWDVSFSKLKELAPAAAQLVDLCAFFAPDRIPLHVIRAGADHLPEPLKTAAGDHLAFEDAVGALLRYSLATRHDDTISIHRLVQQVTRDRLSSEDRATLASAAVEVINAALPDWPYSQFSVPTATVYDSLAVHGLAAADAAEAESATPVETARALDKIGLYRALRGEYAEAKAAWQRALGIMEQKFGPDHPEVAIQLSNLGAVLRDIGDPSGARPLLERALAIDEQALGLDHPHVAIRLSNLAMVLREMGDLADAKRLLERALSIDEQAVGLDHPKVAKRLSNLGLVVRDMGDPTAAKPLLERAIGIDEKASGPDHPSVAVRLNNLGTVLRDMGDLAGANRLLERGLAIFLKSLPPLHPDIARVRANLAEVDRRIARDGG